MLFRSLDHDCGCGYGYGLGLSGALVGQGPWLLEELGHADASDTVRSRAISKHRHIAGRGGNPAHLLSQDSIAARAHAAGLVLVYLSDRNAIAVSFQVR